MVSKQLERNEHQVIHKYLLEITDYQEINMPSAPTVLCVQTQNDHPYLWAVVFPTARMVKKAFYVVGAGHPMPKHAGRYVGTFQMHHGRLVFHVFEEEP